jgi:hypothetical protein
VLPPPPLAAGLSSPLPAARAARSSLRTRRPRFTARRGGLAAGARGAARTATGTGSTCAPRAGTTGCWNHRARSFLLELKPGGRLDALGGPLPSRAAAAAAAAEQQAVTRTGPGRTRHGTSVSGSARVVRAPPLLGRVPRARAEDEAPCREYERRALARGSARAWSIYTRLLGLSVGEQARPERLKRADRANRERTGLWHGLNEPEWRNLFPLAKNLSALMLAQHAALGAQRKAVAVRLMTRVTWTLTAARAAF